MDFKQAMMQFFDAEGKINIPPQLSMTSLSELLFAADSAAGKADTPVLHFWDYSSSREGEAVVYTRAEINTRIKAVAARLQQVAAEGDRIAILAGNCPEYLFGFLGAMYADMIPVPLYDPTEPGHGDHLRAVLADSEPTVILTNRASASAVRAHFAGVPSKQRPRILAVDTLPDTLAEQWQRPQPGEGSTPLDQVAFLQYTSGSTRTPAGVVLSNRSILTNVLQIFAGVNIQTPARLVTWLPLHHDMGIILGAFVTLMGLPLDLMTPRDFIQQPSRWVNLIARRGDDDVNTYLVVPNFALELAVRYGDPTEDQDFSNIDCIIIGSEPVSESAVENFASTFGAHGLSRSALRPSYGMAEASLIVTTPQRDTHPLISYFDREQLAAGRAEVREKGAEGAVPFASNGQIVPNQGLTIVDPETLAELPDGVVGEIWLNGQNMAKGYLGREEDSAETFNRTIGARLEEGSRIADYPDEGWMATGDLGVLIDGETYITGRLKDMVVIAGRNHYPQDIEATVQEASQHVRADSVAAFSAPGDDVEQLIILVERGDQADPADDGAAIEAIREAVVATHGINPAEIKFYAPGEILRSSSGKIARRVNQKAYLA